MPLAVLRPHPLTWRDCIEPLSGCEAHSVLFSPCPRQQLVEIVRGPAVDELGEDVGEIGFGVDAVNLGGLDQGRETGPTCRTGVATREETILSIQCDRAHGALASSSDISGVGRPEDRGARGAAGALPLSRLSLSLLRGS